MTPPLSVKKESSSAGCKAGAGQASISHTCLAWQGLCYLMPRHSSKPDFQLIFNLALALHTDVWAWWSTWPIKTCKSWAFFHCFIQSLKWRWWILNLEWLQQHAVSTRACTLLSEKMMTKPNPDFLLIWPILNQTAKKDTKAATVKRAAPWISNCVYLLHWGFFACVAVFLLPLNVRSFYLNETISKHFYTHVESGTYLLSDSYLLPVNISQPQDLPDESRDCSVLLFRSLIKNRIKWEGWS